MTGEERSVQTLGDLRVRSRSNVTELAGRTHYGVFERRLDADRFDVRKVGTGGRSPQGVVVKAIGAELRTNGVRSSTMGLWWPNAPDVVEFDVIGRRPSAVIRFWNTWRHTSGVEHAWTGNSGVVVEQLDGRIRLCCSDGVGEIDLGDLVVDIHGLNSRVAGQQE